jgi:hypothetical protein
MQFVFGSADLSRKPVLGCPVQNDNALPVKMRQQFFRKNSSLAFGRTVPVFGALRAVFPKPNFVPKTRVNVR